MRPLLIVLALAACSHPAVDGDRFRALPVERPPLMVPLEVAGVPVGYVELASGGPLLSTVHGQRLPFLHVRLTVRNGDADAFSLPLAELALEAAGARVAPAFVLGALVVPRGDVRTIEVVFPLAGPGALLTLRRFEVFWGLDLPGGMVRKSTAFERAETGYRALN